MRWWDTGWPTTVAFITWALSHCTAGCIYAWLRENINFFEEFGNFAYDTNMRESEMTPDVRQRVISHIRYLCTVNPDGEFGLKVALGELWDKSVPVLWRM